MNVGKFGGSRLPRIPKHVSTDARARTPTSRAAHTLAHVRVRASVVRTNNPRFRLFRPFLFRQPVVYQYLHSFPLRRCVFFLRQLPTFFQPHASVVEWLRASGVRGRGLLREDRLESERERVICMGGRGVGEWVRLQAEWRCVQKENKRVQSSEPRCFSASLSLGGCVFSLCTTRRAALRSLGRMTVVCSSRKRRRVQFFFFVIMLLYSLCVCGFFYTIL